jgi:DNA polymerase elongation subunit (family B)
MRKSTRAPAPTSSAPALSGEPEKLLNVFYDDASKLLGVVSRGADGRSIVRRTRPEWSCFLRASEVSADLRRELGGSPSVVAIRPEGEWLRVCWRNRYDLHRVSTRGGFFEQIGIDCMEADVDPIRRYITDHPVEIAKPRRVYLDVEADNRPGLANKEQARMLSWALVDEERMLADRVLVVCPHEVERHRCPECKELEEPNARVVFEGRGGIVASGLLSEDTDEAEAELLEALVEALEPYDQVLAWNGDGYDFPYLRARIKRRRVAFDHQRLLWLDQLTNFRRMNMSAAESGDEKQSLALAAVSKSVVKLRQGKLDGIDGSQSWNLWTTDPEALLRYNEHDARLQALVERRTGYVELLLTLCQATHTFPDSNGIKPTRQVEGFLLRLGRERGIRFPTHHYAEVKDAPRDKYEGAYVQEPKVNGVANNVHVCDFSRLYPSVILSFNLSLETVRGRAPVLGSAISGRPSYLSHLPEERPREQIPEGRALVPGTRVLVDQEPRGVLCDALETALALRKVWDKKKTAATPGTDEWKEADRRSSAYKIFANSFYGVVGSPFSRFFLRDVAESTSLGGVWLIKETIAAAEARGWTVIYGDTDSAFVTGCSDEEFVAFVEWCNAELYPSLLRAQGAKRNTVSLAYEKKFRRAVFASKKRYAASYAHYKGTAATKESKLEVKGLEYKRGDTSRLARRLQLEVVELLLREECNDPSAFAALLDRRKKHVLEANLPLEDVVLAKRLTKELGKYATKEKKDGTRAEQATHVEIARELSTRDDEEVRGGMRIEYVVVDGGVAPIKAIPACDYDPKAEGRGADRFYLWEHLVYPPTQRVLEAAFPGHDWTTWERVRPPKPRRRGKAVPEEQTGFDFTLDLRKSAEVIAMRAEESERATTPEP